MELSSSIPSDDDDDDDLDSDDLDSDDLPLPVEDLHDDFADEKFIDFDEEDFDDDFDDDFEDPIEGEYDLEDDEFGENVPDIEGGEEE